MTVQTRGGGERQDLSFLPRLLLLAACFSTGVVLGQVVASRTASGPQDELLRYLTDFLSLSADPDLSARTFLSAVVLYFRYPLLAFLFGFFSAGIVLLPLLAVVFGFFLSYSVSCLTAVFGGDGIWLALAVMGVRCLVTLPCFFFLAVSAFQRSSVLAANLFHRGKRLCAPVNLAWRPMLAILALLLCGVLFELFLSPNLVCLVLENVLSG